MVENETSVTSVPGRDDARLADGQHEIVDLRHVERRAVEELVLEEHDRVGVADRGLQQALGVGGALGRDHFEARDVRVPGSVILAVLRADAGAAPLGPRNTMGQPIWPPDM